MIFKIRKVDLPDKAILLERILSCWYVYSQTQVQPCQIACTWSVFNLKMATSYCLTQKCSDVIILSCVSKGHTHCVLVSWLLSKNKITHI